MTFATMPTEFIEKYVAFNLHIRRRGICSAPKNREEEETISFLRSSPSYPFLKLYDDDLAASTQLAYSENETVVRSFHSFAVGAAPADPPPAQKIKFSLCVTKSPPPPLAFTFPSLERSANSGEGCATHLPNLIAVSEMGHSVGPTFPFTTCRRNVWPLFPGRHFRYRSLHEREREREKNAA